MYNKIIVPLDGSELAECVLPHLETIVGGCHVPDIFFIQVVQPLRMPSMGDYIPCRMDAANKVSAGEYLNGLISRLEFGQANSQTEVIFDSRVAESLADYASRKEEDLIVVATHGRSGVSRWVWGSITDRILHSSCVPVLMVRAPGSVPSV